MTVEHFEALLEKLMSRRPFQPFTIELNGGKRFEIDGPHAVTWRDGMAIFIAPGTIPIWFDHETVSQFIESPAHSVP